MLLMACITMCIGLVNAQISKVTGTVISEEDGLPVVGASVLVKGTTTGTVTDMDGKFVLENIPSSAKTLMISFIGMKTVETKIENGLIVYLKSDTELLNEVVVVAYGTARKESLTGSVAQIDNKSIEIISSVEGEGSLQLDNQYIKTLIDAYPSVKISSTSAYGLSDNPSSSRSF